MTMTGMARTLDVIVELQQALRELGEGETRLGGVPDWMRELDQEHATKRAEIAAIEQEVLAATVERRTAEGALVDAQEKLRHYQQQIGLVRTQREYAALLQEIDGVKGQMRALEEQALQALERAESEQARVEAARVAFAETDDRHRGELEKWDAEKPSVQKAVDRSRGRVEELKSRVPAPILARFLRLLERRSGAALAAVRPLDRAGRGQQIWSCGGCNYRVRPQVVVEIRNEGSIIECDSCKRILFVEDAG